MDCVQQNHAKCNSYTSFQKVTCGKPKKLNLSKISPDTYDNRARNVQKMHVLEEAFRLKQKFASAACSAMKHLHRMRALSKATLRSAYFCFFFHYACALMCYSKYMG